MSTIETRTLHGGTTAAIFPSALVVYNFTPSAAADLASLLGTMPGTSVIFLATKFHKDMFSQATGFNRSFVLASKFIKHSAVDPQYPAQWLDEGDFIPILPGNISVEATDKGFRVTSVSPDPEFTLTL